MVKTLKIIVLYVFPLDETTEGVTDDMDLDASPPKKRKHNDQQQQRVHEKGDMIVAYSTVSGNSWKKTCKHTFL